jgi:hypothetical protein
MVWNVRKSWPPGEATRVTLARFVAPIAALWILRAFVAGGHPNLQGAVAVILDAALIGLQGSAWWPLFKADPGRFLDRRYLTPSDIAWFACMIASFLLVTDSWHALTSK